MTTAAQRIEDLLVQDATEGLGPEHERELARLLPASGPVDAEAFLLAAAAVELAYTDTEEPLPTDLRQQLSDQAHTYYDAVAPGPPSPPEGRVVAFPPTRQPAPTSERSGHRAGWALAAAALLVALAGWWPRLVDTPPVDLASTPLPSPETQTSPSETEARQALIDRATDLVQVAWTATDDPAATGASGDVVWSPAEQRGYLRFVDLAINDPAAEQYQLWIFDSAQDERYPVDGGVFDVTTEGEVVIAIDPKLEIRRATLFAITVEKPGGVVVSSRERLPLLAQVG